MKAPFVASIVVGALILLIGLTSAKNLDDTAYAAGGSVYRQPDPIAALKYTVCAQIVWIGTWIGGLAFILAGWAGLAVVRHIEGEEHDSQHVQRPTGEPGSDRLYPPATSEPPPAPPAPPPPPLR